MPKKITFLTRLYFPHIGGVERHLERLSRELVKDGHKIQIITCQHDRLLKERETAGGISIIRIPYPNTLSKIGLWSWISKNRKLLETADVIHAHDVFWWLTPLLYSPLKSRCYLTLHGYDPNQLPSFQRKLHVKLAVKFAQKTMVVGSCIEKLYGIKADVITYGAAEVRRSLKVKTNSAVFLGRLDHDTGIMHYLDMLGQIDSGLFLDIYGDGPLANVVKLRLKQENLPAIYHGRTEEPRKMIAQAKYVFASQYLVMLEAMATKKLVFTVYSSKQLASYVFGHPQIHNTILGLGGVDLAVKFKHLNQSLTDEMVHTAYTWAKKQSWAKLNKQYLEMWDR